MLLAASRPPIEKEIPLITWATPANISYGTAIDGTQLNATADVPGTLTYSPVSGTILNAGIHTLTASFVPDDPASYESVTATVLILVDKITPTIAWSPPSDITYGTALSSLQLNATTSVASPITYIPSGWNSAQCGRRPGIAGNHILNQPTTLQLLRRYPSVSLRPLLRSLRTTRIVPLGQATPSLQRAILVSSTATHQSQRPPSLTTTADSSSIPGTYPITASGAEDPNYSITHVEGTLTVTDKQVPAITWAQPAGIVYGTRT